MVDSLPAEGPSLPRPAAGAGTLDRLTSFRFTYVAIFVFALLYIVTMQAVHALLEAHFAERVAEALKVSPANGPVVPQIQQNVWDAIDSPWTRVGEVRVNAFVLAADGTILYAGGRPVPPPRSEADPIADFVEAARLLPARTEVVVSVPQTSVLAVGVLLLYGSALVTGLFFYHRRVARRESELIQAAVATRDASARRASEIQGELDAVRRRLSEIEPSERAHAEEIRELERERESLRRKLGELAEREGELRHSAARSLDLEQERQALEDLLEEAMEDLGHKESEIQSLQDRLRRADRGAPKSSRARSGEQVSRRMRTLYKNLEIDDRAIHDMVALGDETMKLKAEEAIKRLSEDADNAAIRRKVGGLPPQLSVFELGFAGKGRIYYTRGKAQRFRILAIGAKNTQKTDLEYLSRLSLD